MSELQNIKGRSIPVKNPEGYLDLTAHEALSNVYKEQTARDEIDQRHYRLIKTLMNAIDLMGYDLLSFIEVRDRVSGRIYRKPNVKREG